MSTFSISSIYSILCFSALPCPCITFPSSSRSSCLDIPRAWVSLFSLLSFSRLIHAYPKLNAQQFISLYGFLTYHIISPHTAHYSFSSFQCSLDFGHFHSNTSYLDTLHFASFIHINPLSLSQSRQLPFLRP